MKLQPHKKGAPLSPLLANWQAYLQSERVTVGRGLAMYQTGAGKVIYTPPVTPVTIDLAGVLHGPFAGDGEFVVVDLSAATCTQQAAGTVRPSVPPKNKVWIDLSQTVGRVYLPRVG